VTTQDHVGKLIIGLVKSGNMIKLIDILNEILEEKLCKKGEAYRQRRMKPKSKGGGGEKSSAYLSGRASKVCQGLMEEDNKIITCVKCEWHWPLADGGDDPYVCHKCGYDNSSIYNSIEESLNDWFKEKWVRIDTQGNITGPCGSMKKGNKTTRCLPNKKAQSLTKDERAATSKKKTASNKQFVPNTDKAKVKSKK